MSSPREGEAILNRSRSIAEVATAAVIIALSWSPPAAAEVVEALEHLEVQPGDTLSAIAHDHGLSVEQLLSLNPGLDDADRLQIGQQLWTPAVGEPLEQGEGTCELLLVAELEGVTLPIDNELDRSLVFSDRVSEAFIDGVIALAERLEMDPDHLMAIMHFETGGSFAPSIRNPSSAAVGLIQFLPSTARALGTTDEALAQMTAVEQLEWVERYLTPFRGRMRTLEDAYMAVLYPAAVSRPPQYVLFRRGSNSYDRNPGLDRDADGAVSKGEVGARVRQVLERGRGGAEG